MQRLKHACAAHGQFLPAKCSARCVPVHRRTRLLTSARRLNAQPPTYLPRLNMQRRNTATRPCTARQSSLPYRSSVHPSSAPQQTVEACRLGRLPHAEGRQIRPRNRAGGALMKAAHALQPPQSNTYLPRCLHFTTTQHTHSCNMGNSLAQEPGQGGIN